MATNILGIGQSALAAAMAGITTTGHNIANANTPGYSRQQVIQATAGGQNLGYGFVGTGTEVADVRRVFDQFLNTQVLSAQTTSSQLDTYSTQIGRINNLLADSTSGLSPALQDFFAGVQDLASNPSSTASRQSALSAAQTLAGRFQSMDGQFNEMRQGVNSAITESIGTINSYAQQIAKLNDAIVTAQSGSDAHPANDLLDQRDQLVNELSKQVKVTVVKQDASYSVFIGNGQPMVVGNQAFTLTPMAAPTDLGRIEVGYVANGKTTMLAENGLPGGTLGGLMDYRTNTLDAAQNSLGRVATGLAATFNAQHELGQDQNGALGGAFFTVAPPLVNSSTANAGTANVTASISDAGALTTSDYRLQVLTAPVAGPPAVAGAYRVTRLSDGTTFGSALPQTIDGVDFNISAGTQVAGDEFLVKPTVNGASGIGVAITDVAKIAAAAPIRTSAPAPLSPVNTGTGKISAGTVNTPPPPNANLQQPVTITFRSATKYDVTGTGILPGTTGIIYTPGASISYNGWTAQITGAPASGDTFAVGPNTGGVGDNRNALLLASLQTANTLANGTASYQSAYGQLVNTIGNKAHELDVTSSAESALLSQAVQAQQSESGVNLDEEATNLLRYQQAYQAAGKVMQTASTLFNVLLTLGGP